MLKPAGSHRIVSALLVCIPVLLGGCHAALPTSSEAQLERWIMGETLLGSTFATDLRALAMTGGRLSGTPNGRRGEEYVAARARGYGLERVWYEPFELDCWASGATTVTLLDTEPRVLPGALALGRTITTPPGGIAAEVVAAGGGTAEEFAAAAEELPGRFVLVRDGGPSRSAKTHLALQYGAAGLLIMRPEGRVPIIGNAHDMARPEPVVNVAHDSDLVARLAAGERPRMRIELAAENWRGTARNVVAEIPGNGPQAEEIIILCAHLDSWHLAEGALDNGAGSAVVLEAARVLAAADWRPQRTVRFLWFMGEELGLLGSTAYVAAHSEELPRIVAVINTDMPGAPQYFGQFTCPEIEPVLADLIADLPGLAIRPEIRAWSGAWSDHAPFVERGVCALSLGGDQGPGAMYYHTAADTFETVDVQRTVPTAGVLALLVRRLADLPERPTGHRATGTESTE